MDSGSIFDFALHFLVGRHLTCTQAVNPDCTEPAAWTPAPADVSLTVTLPWVGQTNYSISAFPNVRGEVDGPTLVASGTATPVGVQATITIPALADGEAALVTITPGGSTDVTLPTVSTKSSLVSSRIAARAAAGSSAEINVVSMPIRLTVTLSWVTVPPYTFLGAE